MRADVNVSVRKPGGELGTRTETKNVNSVRFVMASIEYEAQRQVDVLESGGRIVQETRLFNPDTGTTRSMRSKEDAHDYRYFPDPDSAAAGAGGRVHRGLPALAAGTAGRQAQALCRGTGPFRLSMPRP